MKKYSGNLTPAFNARASPSFPPAGWEADVSPHQHSDRNHALKAVAGSLALLALPYAAYVAATWYRYGRTPEPASSKPGREGSLIDQFMPTYEVAERHEIDVSAPAELTMAAAREMDLYRSTLVHAIFVVRTLPSRLRGAPPREPTSLLSETRAIGWRTLAEVPNREIVMGAVTQPWRAEVTFRGVEPDHFAGFAEPGYAKIVWTLEAVPLGPAASRFSTETRVSTTDPRSRALFRRYWAALSPGILLVRRESLKLVKADAERRFQAAPAIR
jgi:hypothetical protein